MLKRLIETTLLVLLAVVVGVGVAILIPFQMLYYRLRPEADQTEKADGLTRVPEGWQREMHG